MAPEAAPVRVVKKLSDLIEKIETRRELCEKMDALQTSYYMELRDALDKEDVEALRDLSLELEFLTRFKLEVCRRD